MGNLDFVSFKRDVSNEEFEEALSEVAEELFDDRVYIEKWDEWDEWTALLREDLIEDTHLHKVCFNISRRGPRKFGGKESRSLGEWIRLLLVETAASRIGHALMTNEGVEGSWEPKPLAYLTYEQYLREVRHCNPYRDKKSTAAQALLERAIKSEMKYVPSELLKTNLAE